MSTNTLGVRPSIASRAQVGEEELGQLVFEVVVREELGPLAHRDLERAREHAAHEECGELAMLRAHVLRTRDEHRSEEIVPLALDLRALPLGADPRQRLEKNAPERAFL